METIDLTTADFDTLKTYIEELRDMIMNKDLLMPIAESLTKRGDLSLFQKCAIMDLIAERSEESFARNPALAAPKGMPLLVKGIVGYRMGMNEAASGKIKNTIPAWCETQKSIYIASQPPTAQPLNDEQPAEPVTIPNDEQPTFDRDKFKQFFKPVFFADDFKERETLNDTIKLSRFDIFIEQLESLLSDAKCKKKTIGFVAYMVHKSRFAKEQYKRRGKFAQTFRLFFECCQREALKDMKPNKYNQPDNDTLQRFSDALGNPINPQK